MLWVSRQVTLNFSFFKISCTKNMSNKWFITIMSKSYSFNSVFVFLFFFEKYKKEPKSVLQAFLKKRH